MNDPTFAVRHRREVGNDFVSGDYFNACSCGWESVCRSPVLADVQRNDSDWRDHLDRDNR